MKKEFYTAGELAKLTGVSYKTIRHYQQKGLLEPEKYTDGGYRLYGTKTVELLERILMLKYLDFSLDEIKKMLGEEDTKEALKKQEDLLRAQKEHIEQLLTAVEEMQKVREEEQWEKMLEMIRMTQQKEEIIKQYKESGNLQKRINIHVYSTAKTDWFQWVLDGLQLRSGMKILDIGCGNGMFWIAMRDKLPTDLEVIMTDNSEKMLQAAKSGISEYAEVYEAKRVQFSFLQRDAENFQIEEDEFDRVIANHMLYHVSNEKRGELLRKCAILLKKDGMFYASTVGQTHMQELFRLIEGFEPEIELPTWMSENFELENGGKQLEKVFSKVIMEEQENDLLVPEPQAIYDYVDSLPGKAREILQQKKSAWMKYLKSNISEDMPYFIHKSTGAFKAFKEEPCEKS